MSGEALSGDHGTVVPPVPIPNTEVKRCCADDSMATGHAKVGRCQINTPRITLKSNAGFFCAPASRAPVRMAIIHGTRSATTGPSCFARPLGACAADPIRDSSFAGLVPGRAWWRKLHPTTKCSPSGARFAFTVQLRKENPRAFHHPIRRLLRREFGRLDPKIRQPLVRRLPFPQQPLKLPFRTFFPHQQRPIRAQRGYDFGRFARTSRTSA